MALGFKTTFNRENKDFADHLEMSVNAVKNSRKDKSKNPDLLIVNVQLTVGMLERIIFTLRNCDMDSHFKF